MTYFQKSKRVLNEIKEKETLTEKDKTFLLGLRSVVIAHVNDVNKEEFTRLLNLGTDVDLLAFGKKYAPKIEDELRFLFEELHL
ncbi:hypothetical protein A3C28_06050 [Candidatus Roizmanbacteria bacterium RIFCSPHIGHO2_02_FULL_39_9]|uniref:Uncharacterized protein n=2 Tax=Candidatus Roizmaniibacteriota TaxID=1752723 RepID=A0A1F7I499_9BACT|nr:MAG: hypothetical protein A3C28_06050 [Candidatus Roizmanbacteria bacterium RIFCSPHIGHO2_02_FULL_39_9]OGK38158.1 MAG: hypothetical protein A3F60_03145 [Candidatus Roizmanbacteria bacterium RIFCSPHIGHO2_12_FULL_39_8]